MKNCFLIITKCAIVTKLISSFEVHTMTDTDDELVKYTGANFL